VITASLPLRGRGIAVTRPAQQAFALSAAIKAAGGTPILFPALEITDAPDPAALLQLIERLDSFDLAIFVSPNAVVRAMQAVRPRGEWPSRVRVAAIGAGTVRALLENGVAEVIAPDARYDSETLLALDDLQAARGKRVVIFRGNGGRELLADTLRARGAHVEYAECYRRGKPDIDAAILLEPWARNALHAVTVTSSEGLRNLFEMVGASAGGCLRLTPLFVPHERIAAAARELEVREVHVTQPGDEGLMQALTKYFADPRNAD
jgi:uroporphyrinogen-III synthase